MCEGCFSEDRIKTTMTLTVEQEGVKIMIKNIPCLKCRKCGEVTFTDAVSERLEQLTCNVAGQGIVIIDYEIG